MKKRIKKERIVRFHENGDENEIKIKTKVPSKWLFVDRETGHVWRWDEKKERFSSVLGYKMDKEYMT